jgi:PAS domain S-box-containing protein
MENLFDLSPDLMCLATVDGYFKRVNLAFERTLGYTPEQFVARPILDFVHPEDRERTRTAMGVQAGGGALRQFENRYVCRDGSVRWLQWNTRPAITSGLVAAAARDITDSLRRREQAALRRVATVVAHGAAPSDVFTAVAAEIANLLNADLTLIGRYETDATFSYLAAGGPMQTSSPLGDRLKLGGDNLASNILRSGQPESMSYDDNGSGPIAVFARRLALHSAVGTPILVDGRIWGAMFAGWPQPREISSQTMERLCQITDLVAAAIANAESRSALIESRARVVAAGDDSRRRIERDLHDGAQQRLVTLALRLRSHEAAIPAGLREVFNDVASGLDEALNDIRELSRGIHPTVLSRSGLGPALRELGRRAPLPTDVAVRIPTRPAERIEIAIYYVVAEALTNIAKHARASQAVVEVDETDGIIRVSVSDDGVGGADLSRGSGLFGLRDRVDALGGTMSVNSPASGTTLVVELPRSV